MNTQTTASNKSAKFSSREILISQITPDLGQARKSFPEAMIQQRADSMKTIGQIQPILLRQLGEKSFQILDGECRFRAAKLLGWTKLNAIIRTAEDLDANMIGLAANMHRTELSPLEQANAFQTAIDTHKLGINSLADATNFAQPFILKRLNLLKLSEQAQDALERGDLSLGQAEILCKLTPEQQKRALAILAKSKGLELSEFEHMITRLTAAAPGEEDATAEALEKKASQPQKANNGKDAAATIAKPNDFDTSNFPRMGKEQIAQAPNLLGDLLERQMIAYEKAGLHEAAAGIYILYHDLCAGKRCFLAGNALIGRENAPIIAPKLTAEEQTAQDENNARLRAIRTAASAAAKDFQKAAKKLATPADKKAKSENRQNRKKLTPAELDAAKDLAEMMQDDIEADKIDAAAFEQDFAPASELTETE